MKGVIFDLDDTLYPERTYVRTGFRAVASFLATKCDRPADQLAERLEQLHERDGRGRLFDTLIAELALSDLDGTLALACVATYRSHVPLLEPFPDTVGTMGGLRAGGLRLGIVSDGLASVQRTKLAALPDVSALIDAIVLTDELGDGYAKPSPVPFRVACALLAVAPSDAVYVGNDPRKDFAGARTAGLQTIRVGRLPDEGGGRIQAMNFPDDADRTIAGLASLPKVLGVAEAGMRG